MNSVTSLQPVRPADVENWVYIGDVDDEPTIYEADIGHGECSEKGSIEHIDVLFKSEKPVEDVHKQTKEEIYCDEEDEDEDIIEDRVLPETAFELFLARNYPLDKLTKQCDFSGSIYHQSGQHPQQQQTQLLLKKGLLPGAESQSERLQRLINEVDALSTEVGLSTNGDGICETLSQISDLRQKLQSINLHCSSSSSPPSTIAFLDALSSSSPLTVPADDPITTYAENEDSKSTNVQVISPSLSAIYALERRVLALETSVNVHDLERKFNGQSINDLLSDVKARFALMTDPNLSSRLCDDAQRIASILNNTDIAELVRLGSLLDKLHEWQPIIDDIPIIVDRLTSVRHLHEEASHFVDAASKLSNLIDQVDNRSSQNQTLLNTVQSNMQSNMEIINQNFEALRSQIDRPPVASQRNEGNQQQPSAEEASAEDKANDSSSE